MHTKTVYRTAQALNEAGLVALRFNFRGVGTSTGSYDGGVGEQEDLSAALDWLEYEYPALPLVAGGFSFGSRVALTVGADDDRVAALLGLGIPVDLDRGFDYGFLSHAHKPVLIVQGEEDEYGGGELVQRTLAPLGSHVTVVRIRDSDHYFTDRLDDVRGAVRGYYESGPGARSLARL